MIEVVVIVATLLGGLAALWFFWDKIVAWVHRIRAKRTLPQFAPGRWRSDGGTNKLIIAKDLSWTWTSTHQGRWHGSGRGEVRDDQLALHGSREGTTPIGQAVPSGPISFRLRRERDRLEGQLQTSYTYDLRLIREE
jgi:hypothetical protein